MFLISLFKKKMYCLICCELFQVLLQPEVSFLSEMFLPIHALADRFTPYVY